MKKLLAALMLVSAFGAASAAADERPLANEDVVALVRAGLGDEVVVAKIQQAPKENLDVSTDALIQLSKAKLSRSVIDAMVKRVELRNKPTAPAAPAGAASPNRAVSILLDGKPLLIEPLPGTQRNVDAYFVKKIFLDFPGTAASVKTTSRRPELDIASEIHPGGVYWCVQPKVLEDKGVRTVKFGSMRGAIAPDEDWTVQVTIEKRAEGLWAMVPKKDLKPGEYGVFRLGKLGEFGTDLLFGFTVE